MKNGVIILQLLYSCVLICLNKRRDEMFGFLQFLHKKFVRNQQIFGKYQWQHDGECRQLNCLARFDHLPKVSMNLFETINKNVDKE